MGKMVLRVTFQSLGLKGITWQEEHAEGGEPDAVQHSGRHENIP